MKTLLLALAIAALVAVGRAATARELAVPEGARTHWVIRDPHEIVAWVAFDTATVRERLPDELRFVTIGELAAGGVGWAAEQISEHPQQRGWGVSFLEIVQAGTFTLDGRSPAWPAQGAAALWFARVAPADSAADLGPGLPYLMLEFWLPDRAFVQSMRGKGHYATYGRAELARDTRGHWRGAVHADGLDVAADCLPAGPVEGGDASAGTQALFPPRGSGITSVVRIAFAGHRVQDCAAGSSWRLHGSHPLARGAVLAPSSYEFGYELDGGACAP